MTYWGFFLSYVNRVCFTNEESPGMSRQKNHLNQKSRRSILKLTALGLGNALLNGCASNSSKNELKISNDKESGSSRSTEKNVKVFQKKSTTDGDIGPIDRTLGEVSPLKYSGDNPDSSHQVLWDVSNFKSKYNSSSSSSRGEVEEKVPLIIVGGGLSGLLAAYRMKKYVPIILESSERFGGLAKGETWKGIDYSLGGYELKVPPEGSSLDQFYKELELYSNHKKIMDESSIQLKNKIYYHFFKGDTDTQVANQVSQLEKYFNDILDIKGGKVFPQIPPLTSEQKKLIHELDQLTIRDHLKKVLETDTLHPHLDTWLEHYCWQNFGASAREISAAMGVNHMSSIFGKTMTIPGGLAQVSEKLFLKVKNAVGSDRLRARSLVFQVQIVDEGVSVSYFKDGEIKTLLAESVILACGKNIVKKIYPELSKESDKVIRRLRYNGCLVANLFVKHKLPNSLYKVTVLNEGKLDPKEVQTNSERDRVVLVTNATFASSQNKKEDSILTLYRPMPYMMGKSQIYSSASYFKYRKEFIDQIENSLLPSLGISTNSMNGLRVARWGHAYPVPLVGLIKDGDLDQIQKPIQDKLYFINQDNWCLPHFETIFLEVDRWVSGIEKSILDRREKKLKGEGSDNSKIESHKDKKNSNGILKEKDNSTPKQK